MNRLLAAATAGTAFLVVLTGCSTKPAQTPTPSVGGSSASTASSTSGSATASSSGSGSASADTQGCSWGEMPEPTKFDIPARQISEPMLSLGLDAQGNVAAPPHDQKFSVGWWNGGPKVGADKGHVILTAHTWYGDVALGNVLYDKDKGLRAGDVIRISDGSKTVCYRYTETKTIDVATYDPNSTVWIDANGDPKLTIMICWDYNTSKAEWMKRIIFFADPIRP